MPAGKGLLLLSQLVVGEKLATNAVAQQLLANLIDYGRRYKLEYRQVAAVRRATTRALPKALDAIGLQYTRVDDPLAGARRRRASSSRSSPPRPPT